MSEPIKVCSTCRLALPLSAFTRNRSAKDGRASQCKDCRKEYRERNRDKYNEYMREYFSSSPLKRKKQNARGLLNNAVDAGRIPVLPCHCGRTDVTAHHEDYDKPLDVVWLCPDHHREHDPSAGGRTHDATKTPEQRYQEFRASKRTYENNKYATDTAFREQRRKKNREYQRRRRQGDLHA